MIYLRIMQEYLAASRLLDESLGLKANWVNLKQYGDTVENHKKLWLLCMEKLFSEGYSFFEANLASNHIVDSAISLANPNRETMFKDDPISAPHNEITNSYAVETSNPAFEAWKFTDTLSNTTKELLYVKFRKEALEEQAEFRRWYKEVKEWLIREIESGGWSESIKLACQKAAYTQVEIKQVLDMYQDLIAEGYNLKLPVKVKETESNVTIESVTDSDQGNKEETKQ